ncbi:unnamed protein product [Vitrella brassicaformis CCMP3155]|uniref:Uncharacterized protein n=1 Tax=Vitrella brassicaformis (strain CCMP3155) TaxID=1169540 RepID=A0A0G4EEM5_VITBC|nr:unnamed protein product [Vitrella brassicaformis CCMP3155]|eukprot:CEL94131.1 unnamed protein product [Vitrella brassicaformis CCMP3155]
METDARPARPKRQAAIQAAASAAAAVQMKRKAVDEPMAPCESSSDCSDWEKGRRVRGAKNKRKARRVGNKTVKGKGGEDEMDKKGVKRAKKTKRDITPKVAGKQTDARPARPKRQAAIQAAASAAAAVQMKRKAVDEPMAPCESSSDCSDWEKGRRVRGAKNKRKARRVGNKTVKGKGGEDEMDKKGVKRAKKTKALTPDVDMKDEFEAGPEDALKALSRVAYKLKAQLNMMNEAKAKAEQVLDVKMAIPEPDTQTKQNRIQEVERHFCVWKAMVMKDAKMQVRNADETAAEQMEACIKKLDDLQHTMNNLDKEELRSALEELPEALWMTTEEGMGLGAYLGFHTFMTSLAPVCTHFHTLSQQARVHPILDIHSDPPEHIAKRLPVSRADVHHPPTPTLVGLLERFARTIEAVELHGHTKRSKRRYRRRNEYAARWRDIKEADLDRRYKPLKFLELTRAAVNTVWANATSERAYELPALRHLSVASVDILYVRRGFKGMGWVDNEASPGLSSLHLMYDPIKKSIQNTKTAKSLRSLTGRITIKNQEQYYHGWYDNRSSVEQFKDLFTGPIAPNKSRLRKVQLSLPEIRSADTIQKLHSFRISCLADGASETYKHCPDRGPPEGLRVRLPFTGSTDTLTAAIDTLKICCQQAKHATLQANGNQGNYAKSTPQLGSVVFSSARLLTVESGGYVQVSDLPAYIRQNSGSMFPNVESVVLNDGGRDAAFYEHGVGDVLSGLTSADHLQFELSARADPDATLCLVPAGCAFLPAAGSDLAVTIKATVSLYPMFGGQPGQVHHSVQWQLYGGEGEAGRQVLAGRLAALEVDMSIRYKEMRLSENEAKAMFRSLAEAAAAAFASFPKLKGIVVSPFSPKPKFGLVGVFREAGQKRFTVSHGEGKTIVLRPNTHSNKKHKRQAGSKATKGSKDSKGDKATKEAAAA